MAGLVAGVPRGAAEFYALCDELWSEAIVTDIHGFKKRSVELLNEFQSYLVDFNYRKAAIVLLAFHVGYERARYCSQQSIHYKCSIATSIEVAAQAANLRRFLGTYQLAAEIREALAECIRNYQSEDGNSMFMLRIRTLVIWLLAECKWQDIAANRDLLASPEDLYLDFRVVFPNVIEKLSDKLAQKTALQNVAYFLLNTEFALLRLATRFHPEMVPELVAQFNERYGGCLQPELWHFRDNPTLRGETANYWHYEIAKLHIADELTAGILDFCFDQLQKNLTDRERNNKAHCWALEQYYKYLRRTTQLQLFDFQSKRK